MQFYPKAIASAFAKNLNFLSDNMVATLHSSTYVPADSHQFVSDLASTELATGGGYTNGGVALANKVVNYYTAAQWGARTGGTYKWAASTAFAQETVVAPVTANGFLYRCATAGTSGSSEPTWNTSVGLTTTDGTVVWENIGKGITMIDFDDPAWPSATFTGARILVVSDRTPGTAATQPLLGFHNFGGDQAGQGGTFTDQMALQGALLLAHPFV